MGQTALEIDPRSKAAAELQALYDWLQEGRPLSKDDLTTALSRAADADTHLRPAHFVTRSDALVVDVRRNRAGSTGDAPTRKPRLPGMEPSAAAELRGATAGPGHSPIGWSRARRTLPERGDVPHRGADQPSGLGRLDGRRW